MAICDTCRREIPDIRATVIYSTIEIGARIDGRGTTFVRSVAGVSCGKFDCTGAIVATATADMQAPPQPITQPIPELLHDTAETGETGGTGDATHHGDGGALHVK